MHKRERLAQRASRAIATLRKIVQLKKKVHRNSTGWRLVWDIKTRNLKKVRSKSQKFAN